MKMDQRLGQVISSGFCLPSGYFNSVRIWLCTLLSKSDFLLNITNCHSERSKAE